MSELKTEKDVHSFWTKKAQEVLKNKTIVDVRYLNDDEMEMMGWYKRPVCFFLNDGTSCILSCDDEGNDGTLLKENAKPNNNVVINPYRKNANGSRGEHAASVRNP